MVENLSCPASCSPVSSSFSCLKYPLAFFTMAEGTSNLMESQAKEGEDQQPAKTVSLMRQLIDALAKQVPSKKLGNSSQGE